MEDFEEDSLDENAVVLPMDPPQFSSFGADGVAFLDKGIVGTILPWDRAPFPWNPVRVYELRFFCNFLNLNIFDELDTVFDTLEEFPPFRSVMILQPRLTIYYLADMNPEDWVFLADAISQANQGWQIYPSIHTSLMTWGDWQALEYPQPWGNYLAWRDFILDPSMGPPEQVRLETGLQGAVGVGRGAGIIGLHGIVGGGGVMAGWHGLGDVGVGAGLGDVGVGVSGIGRGAGVGRGAGPSGVGRGAGPSGVGKGEGSVAGVGRGGSGYGYTISLSSSSSGTVARGWGRGRGWI